MNIAIIDDDQLVLSSLRRLLKRTGYHVEAYDNPKAYLEVLKTDKKDYDLIISDQRMPQMKGTEMVREIRKLEPTLKTPIIILSAYSDFDDITQSFNQGLIQLFMAKPWDNKELLGQVATLLKLTNEHDISLKGTSNGFFHGIYGRSAIMLACFDMIRKVAQSDVSVLLSGASGSGKEMFARAIHRESDRKDKPFIAINCANLHADLFEAQLFGYHKGAFTGADSNHQGFLAMAQEGTVFLDEVAEIPLGLQAKLLRALQEKSYYPMGVSIPEKFSARIISASHQLLDVHVAEGKFRQDLFYRIHVLPICIPALYERREDIMGLLDYFFAEKFHDKTPVISQNLSQFLQNYAWPGNVRELKNLVEYLSVLYADVDVLECEHLPQSMVTQRDVHQQMERKSALSQEELVYALEKCRYNQSAAAEVLGVSRMTVWRMMKKYRT